MDRFQGDPYLTITPNGSRLTIKGGDPVRDQGFENQVIISLFTREGWAGNYLLDDSRQHIGSDYEETTQQPITLSGLAKIEDSAKRAVRSDMFGDVEAVATNTTGNNLDVDITINSTQNINVSRNGGNWVNQKLNPAHGGI